MSGIFSEIYPKNVWFIFPIFSIINSPWRLMAVFTFFVVYICSKGSCELSENKNHIKFHNKWYIKYSLDQHSLYSIYLMAFHCNFHKEVRVIYSRSLALYNALFSSIPTFSNLRSQNW